MLVDKNKNIWGEGNRISWGREKVRVPEKQFCILECVLTPRSKSLEQVSPLDSFLICVVKMVNSQRHAWGQRAWPQNQLGAPSESRDVVAGMVVHS